MKSIFIATNLICGILALICGLVATFYVLHNPLVAIIGVVTVAIAITCIWLAKATLVSSHNKLTS